MEGGIIKKMAIQRRGDISIRIPVDLLKQFEEEVRIVIRHPWVIGIPVPEVLLKPELLKTLKEHMDIMLVPKEIEIARS
jgi:hypothetical protein